MKQSDMEDVEREFDEQAARIAALEAALREIDARANGNPVNICRDMQRIASAALAPAPAQEET